MACLESVCYAGRTKKIRNYYTTKYNDRKIPGRREKRGERKKLTSERQAEINRKMSLRNLTLLLDENFSSSDLYITYNFAKENRPGDTGKFRACVRQLLKSLRKLYRKAGIRFLYIWVGERGEKGAEHIHVVQSGGLTLKELAMVWPHGWVTGKPMDESGSYHKLASYFIKYSDKTMKTENRLQGKRYNPSQNLIHPEPEKERVKKKRLNPNAIVVPKGYYLDKETVEYGVQDNGYEFLEYTLVLVPGINKKVHKTKIRRKSRQPKRTV